MQHIFNFRSFEEVMNTCCDLANCSRDDLQHENFFTDVFGCGVYQKSSHVFDKDMLEKLQKDKPISYQIVTDPRYEDLLNKYKFHRFLEERKLRSLA